MYGPDSIGGIRRLLLAAALCGAGRASALPPQSDHARLQAVPAPGAVTIHGALEDWDRSAEMLVYAARALRERYAAQVHAMWDSQALYLGIHWPDPTPMINNVDPAGAPGEGWMADSLQCRFITDHPQLHLTAWYGSRGDASVAHISYNSAGNADGAFLTRTPGRNLHDPSGFKMAFARDSDSRGYVQEMRIPWPLLYRQPAPRPGLVMGFSGEYFWGGPSGTTWPTMMWSDPVNPELPSAWPSTRTRPLGEPWNCSPPAICHRPPSPTMSRHFCKGPCASKSRCPRTPCVSHWSSTTPRSVASATWFRTERLMWSMTVRSEAEFFPARWGRWILE